MGISGQNTLLIPTDFTSIANCALDHAKEIAKHFNLKIYLLHIIAKNTTKAEMEKIRNQIKFISDFNSQQSDVSIDYIIKEGNIFDGISHAADEVSAELIVMGVHNKRSEVDILGSFAYNVIRSAKVPVMIVNKDNVDITDNHIIVPLDYTKIKSKIKAKIAVKYAKELKCPVYVTGDVYYESSKTKIGADIEKFEKEVFLKNIANYIKEAGVEVKTGMLIKPKTILVPTDFSPDAERALEHAIEIAKAFDRNICLLQVINELASKDEKEKIKSHLKHFAKTKSNQSGVDITYKVSEGGIFDIITATVSEISAGFVVMGYQGKHDIRNLTGGFTHSVISGSRVPVMLVRKTNRKISDNTIVVHIDFSYENLKKISKATKIARHFDCLIQTIVVVDKKGSMHKNEKEKISERVKAILEDEGVIYKTDILEKPKTILVPVDFTKMASYALNHAIETAKLFNRDLILLHVLGKRPSSSQSEEVKNKLIKFFEKYAKNKDVSVSYEIKSGSIFNIITDTAQELSSEFIVMGVHGKKGLQHIMGSYAFKVITSSKVPIMVIKNEHSGKKCENIVVSVDFTDESRVEINTAIKFTKYFDATLHIIGVLRSTSTAYKYKHEAMLSNITNFVKNAGVKVKADLLTKVNVGIHDKVLQYAKKIDADLIMVVAKRGARIAEVLGNNYTERLINKSSIPVLTITPYFEDEDEPTDTYSFSSFVDPFGVTR